MNRISHQDTKIVATVGPASQSYEMLVKLVEKGVDIFRLNFSHGTHAEHKLVIDRIHKINEEYGIQIGILADLQGPKIRIGNIAGGPRKLIEGEEFAFVINPSEKEDELYINYTNFPMDAKPGERVLLDDGKLVLQVISTNKVDRVRMKVLYGGRISANKGVNLPDTKISLPSLTEKDLRDLEFLMTQPVHWIALSFVRSSKDMKKLQKILDNHNHPAKTIAKIEKPDAIKRIDKIIKYSNAIMIARGDLGVEVPMEQLPGMQKKIIEKCVKRARPVIVATQMMESMVVNPSPTRAEITDVANAVMDGADAVMLSAETAVGKHPDLVVEAMNKIIFEAEKHPILKNLHPSTSTDSSTFMSDIICFNSAQVASELNAKAIVGMTHSGYTAFKISSCRPKTPIFIFSENAHILSTLNLVRGVRCYYYDKVTTTDETIKDVIQILKNEGKVVPGDIVVNTGSMPIKARLRTNMLKVTIVE